MSETKAKKGHGCLICLIVFIGFIVASIPMLIREEKKSFKPSVGGFIALGVGIAFVILITMLNKHSFSTGVSMSSITWGSGFLVLFRR